MLEPPLLSLSEITALERSFLLGAPTLGRAARALMVRWHAHLRDEETLLRLAYLRYAAAEEPAWQTGIDVELLPIEDLIVDIGGVEVLGGETCFVLGYFAAKRPTGLGDARHWQSRAGPLVERAAELLPGSELFRRRHWFLGDMERQLEVLHAAARLRTEIRARFAARGLLGDFLTRELIRSVNMAARRPKLV